MRWRSVPALLALAALALGAAGCPVLKVRDPATAHFNHGVMLQDEGHLREALEAYQRALELNPTDVRPRFNLALVRHDLGQEAEAEKEYLKILEINPLHARSLTNLATIYEDRGELDKAELYLRKAREAAPLSAYPRTSYGLFLEQRGDVTGAIAQYEKALALESEDAEAHYRLGQALWRQAAPQRAAEALEHLERAVKLRPDDALYHLGFSRYLAAQGELERAAEELERALAVGGPSVKREGELVELARLYIELRRYDEAVLAFHAAQKLGNRDARVNFEAAQALEAFAADQWREFLSRAGQGKASADDVEEARRRLERLLRE